MTETSSYELSKIIAQAAAEKKAYNIRLIKVGEISIVADFFVIVSGNSATHVQAIADNIKDKLKDKGYRPSRVEGYNPGRWILLDYGGSVVHVFLKQERDFYNLEGLWGDVLQEEYREEA